MARTESSINQGSDFLTKRVKYLDNHMIFFRYLELDNCLGIEGVRITLVQFVGLRRFSWLGNPRCRERRDCVTDLP